MLDAAEQIFDLARAGLGVRVSERGGAAQGSSRTGEPPPGLVRVPENLGRSGKQAGEAVQALGLVRAKASIELPAAERAGRDPHGLREVACGNPKLSLQAFERRVRQAAPQRGDGLPGRPVSQGPALVCPYWPRPQWSTHAIVSLATWRV